MRDINFFLGSMIFLWLRKENKQRKIYLQSFKFQLATAEFSNWSDKDRQKS